MSRLSTLLSVIGENVARRADVSSAFGQPFQVRAVTYVPVARVSYGLGGGDQQGTVGGGGGAEVVPLGLIEVGPEGVQFHPLPGEPPPWAEVAPGILQFHNTQTCWLLVHGSEAVLVDAPADPALPGLVRRVAALQGTEVGRIFLTGTNSDGLADFQRVFPHATVEETWEGDLDGEPLFLLSHGRVVFRGTLLGQRQAPRPEWDGPYVIHRFVFTDSPEIP